MLDRIGASLDNLVLGGTAVVQGVRVRRRSLLGFQVGDDEALLDAREAARRIRGLAKCRAVGVALCTRCGGDGLGRRNRGTCGLCHGPGIQVSAPAGGWGDGEAGEVARAVQQAAAVLGEARYARARASLVEVLAEALPAAPAGVRGVGLEALRRAGFEREAAAIEAAIGGTAAA